MNLKDFFRLCYHGQRICLIICDYDLTSTVEALECLLTEETLSATVDSIEAAEDCTLKIFASSNAGECGKEEQHGTETD